MSKNKPYLKKESLKGYIKAVVILGIAALFLVMFYVTQIKPDRELPTEFQFTSMGEVEEYFLKPGTIVEQEFELKRDRMQAVGMKFGNVTGQSTQTVAVELTEKETGTLLDSWEFSASEIKNPEEYMIFQVDRGTAFVKGNHYVIRCFVKETAGNDEVTVRLLKGSKYHNGILSVNGSVQPKAELQIKLYGDTVDFRNIYKICAAIVLIVLLICMMGAHYGRWSVQVLFLIMGLTLGSIFILTMPPYTTPDEHSHVATIYSNANAVLYPDRNTDEGIPMVREDDLKLETDKNEPSLKLYNYVQDHLFGEADAKELAPYWTDKINVPFMAHLPQTVGVILGMAFEMNGVMTLYLGKIFGLLFYLLCCYFAIRVMPWGKMILFTIACLPMSLQMATSLSYDCVVNALCFLFTAYSMHLIFEKKKVSIGDFGLLALIAAWMVPCKVAYIFVCFICIFIPREKVETKKKYYTGIALVLSAGILAMMILRFSYLIKIGQGGAGGMVGITGEEMSGYTVGWILTNLKESVKMVFNTLYLQGEIYLQTMFGGLLGWLQVEVDWPILIGFLLVLILATVPAADEDGFFSWKQRALLILLCGIMFGGILVALWLDWTPMGSESIQGVQGRYFLPFLPMFVLALRGRGLVLRKKIDYELCFAVFLLNLWAVSQILLYSFRI